LCDVEVGARSATVCHLLNLAYWNHAHLHWDPQKWEFTGANAAEANRWRHRERRSGYVLPEAEGICDVDDPVLPRLRLMNRRGFLGSTLHGLGAIALTSLLKSERLLAAAPSPFRPIVRPDSPLAARLPPALPKAKRLLMFFCSGGVSHVDTFEYKPALVKRSGEPMPGADKIITFQGAQGMLSQSIWPFKPRGTSGKMTSDLLPHIGALADDLCFIHSMTAKSNTHGPAESQMGTGFTLDGYPAMGAWVSYALGTEAEDLPAFVAIPDPRGVPQTGAAQWGSGFLPAVFQGTPFGADKPIANLARPGSIAPATDAASRDLLRRFNDEHLKRHPATRSWPRAYRATNWPGACSSAPRRWGTCPTSRPTFARCTPPRTPTR